MKSLLTKIRSFSINPLFAFLSLIIFSVFLTIGCTGGDALVSITPEQYLNSSLEQIAVLEGTTTDVRDINEIIRVLENAEKKAKKTATIDASRMLLCLMNTLKAEKEYKNTLLKPKKTAFSTPPPDLEPTRQCLREAKKWLRKCNSTFATKSLTGDLNYITGIYSSIKMLTQSGSDRESSLYDAIMSFRRCIAMAPTFEASFMLYGEKQNKRKVLLRLAETLAYGGEQGEAFEIISQYDFKPLSPIAGSTHKEDFEWHHKKALITALMGHLEEASEMLGIFKIIPESDYPYVADAIWLLEGVYTQLSKITKDPKKASEYSAEAKVANGILKKIPSIYSDKEYASASESFLRLTNSEPRLYEGVKLYADGDIKEAYKIFKSFEGKGHLSHKHRISSLIYMLESGIRCNEISQMAFEKTMLNEIIPKQLTPLQEDRAAWLLASHFSDKLARQKNITAATFGTNSYIQTFINKPALLTAVFERGKIKRENKKIQQKSRTSRFSHFNMTEKSKASNSSSKNDALSKPEQKQEPSRIKAEIVTNNPSNIFLSLKLHAISLKNIEVLNTKEIPGREEDGLITFVSEELNEISNKDKILLIVETSDSEDNTYVSGKILLPAPMHK
ncbi:MAG: hypothetical protein GX221_04565 [Candidatus Riflebacteria bacterium]|nr:hypothetical protein [Candidatus Riflebacteria bacterium]